MALSSCPIAFSNKSNVFTNAHRHAWVYIYIYIYDGVRTRLVYTHKDAGSPQWIAFTRRTTTDVSTFIHSFILAFPIHAHRKEYAHQDRNDSIKCVYIQCISRLFIRELKLLTLGKGIDTRSDTRKRSDSAVFFVT